MTPGVNVRSPFPWDLPLWMPDHVIFFGVLYLVVSVIGLGLALVAYKTYKDITNPQHEHSHH